MVRHFKRDHVHHFEKGCLIDFLQKPLIRWVFVLKQHLYFIKMEQALLGIIKASMLSQALITSDKLSSKMQGFLNLYLRD